MSTCWRRYIPVWIQLIMWHVLCFGLVICLWRSLITLLSIIFGGPRRFKTNWTYLKFELCPINRVLIYTHKYSERDYCVIGCVFCQGFFMLPFLFLLIPSGLFCVIFSCGHFLKYHTNRAETGVFGFEIQYGLDVIHEDDLEKALYHNKVMEWKKRYAHPQPPDDFNQYANDKYIKNKNNKTQKSIAKQKKDKKDNMIKNLQLSTEPNEVVEIIDSIDVKQWFQQTFDVVYYNNYYKLFIANGLDTMEIITATTMHDLVSIGVKKLGHRKKIMIEIDKLNRSRSENANEGCVVDQGRGAQITYQ